MNVPYVHQSVLFYKYVYFEENNVYYIVSIKICGLVAKITLVPWQDQEVPAGENVPLTLTLYVCFSVSIY